MADLPATSYWDEKRRQASSHRAAILWIGTVATSIDGYSPILEGWGFDRYDSRQSPVYDPERHTVCGWPIHELAAMAATNA
jgi:hypothetical protein